jgi:hypothetical protein
MFGGTKNGSAVDNILLLAGFSNFLKIIPDRPVRREKLGTKAIAKGFFGGVGLAGRISIEATYFIYDDVGYLVSDAQTPPHFGSERIYLNYDSLIRANQTSIAIQQSVTNIRDTEVL